MPTYEYQCKKCGNNFELYQLMTEEPVKTCPKCDGEVERLIGSGAGVIFKGSGFYSTDYRSESYKKAEKADKPKQSSSDSSSKKVSTDNKKVTTDK